jgi:hypothetical protein
VSRKSSGCRYGHGLTDGDIDHQLRLSERGGMTGSLETQSCYVQFPPLSGRSTSEFEFRVFQNLFLYCAPETRHPCQASDLAGSAIESMRPISMGRNDLLHGQPQYEYDNRLHAPALATSNSSSSSESVHSTLRIE